MNFTIIFITSLLFLAVLTPFIALYAISFIKKKNYPKHIKIQKTLFWICIAAVFLLELYIRISGGSGSLVKDNAYTSTSFFKFTLIAHIIGASLTYVIWGISLFWFNNKYKKGISRENNYNKIHKKLGYFIIIGLFYTAISALVVCIPAFFM